MLMVKEAWNEVSPETIRHCWDHTKIQRIPDLTTSTSDPPPPACPVIAKGWEIIREFASTPMGLPEAELEEAEAALLDAVGQLHSRRRIIGTTMSLEEMLNPVEELEIGDSPYKFEGGDDEIVKAINHEIAVQEGRAMNIEASDGSDDDDKEEVEEKVSA
ncbi:hypothetical protein BDQ12DRAFT_737502 [Crucibulum laeve]|uniref:DDE-1 domain-containing protein n=1 Tax=Crucibulum laeve TaxID=68775 RepID=A0A5C3LR27_9AGAR|nr:hypothetical protein BDQ12DRAFT_737502 [Crucibulum laeve]